MKDEVTKSKRKPTKRGRDEVLGHEQEISPKTVKNFSRNSPFFWQDF